MDIPLQLPIRERSLLRGHTAAISCVKFNTRGEYCVSGGYDKVLRLWNPYNGKNIKIYTGHGYQVEDLAIVQDNSQIASVGGDKVAYLWDVETGDILRNFRGHDYRLNCVEFNREDSTLVTGSFDTTVKIWDLKSRSYDAIQTLADGRDSITGVWAGEYEIISSSLDGRIRTYDIRMGQLTTDTVGKPIASMAVSGDGKMVLASCLDSTIRLFSKSDGTMYQHYTGHICKDYPIQAIFNDTDALVISGSEDGSLHMWRVENGQKMHTDTVHTRRLCNVAHHPTKPYLLTASADKTIKLFEAK